MSHSLWALTLVKLIKFFTLIFAVFVEKLYQIWLHYLIPRRYMTFRIFSRWLPSAILNFEKFKFWINFRGRSQKLHRHIKFGQNRMIGGRDIAIKSKSNMAAAAMLNLLPVYFLTHFEDYGGKICLHTKFHANRAIFGEVITFRKFSRWRPARSRDITICNFWTTHEVAEVFRTCCSNLISEFWLLLDISQS